MNSIVLARQFFIWILYAVWNTRLYVTRLYETRDYIDLTLLSDFDELGIVEQPAILAFQRHQARQNPRNPLGQGHLVNMFYFYTWKKIHTSAPQIRPEWIWYHKVRISCESRRFSGTRVPNWSGSVAVCERRDVLAVGTGGTIILPST